MGWLLWAIIALVAMFGLVAFKGAPYVPTKRKPLQRAFDHLYQLSTKDLLVDIGSGDGVVLRIAAARGARSVGYEINPLLVIVSRLLSRSSLITVQLANYWNVTFPPETTIVYTFGDSRDIVKMYKKAEDAAYEHKKIIYFMSFGFNVPTKKHVKYDGHFYLYKINYLHLDKA